MLELCAYTIIISVVAYVYAIILTDGEMLLYSFKGFLYKRIGKYKIIYKPLIDCEYCVSGQIGFWWYLYETLLNSNSNIQYNLLTHIAFVSFCIFNIAIINKLRIYEG